jgi:hypothetical protein
VSSARKRHRSAPIKHILRGDGAHIVPASDPWPSFSVRHVFFVTFIWQVALKKPHNDDSPPEYAGERLYSESSDSFERSMRGLDSLEKIYNPPPSPYTGKP